MGMFSHKDNKEAVEPQHFVILMMEANEQVIFRQHFDYFFGTKGPQVSLTFSRVPADVATRYSAGGDKDHYLTVTPRQPLTPQQKDEIISAVRLAAGETGNASMCPVRRVIRPERSEPQP